MRARVPRRLQDLLAAIPVLAGGGPGNAPASVRAGLRARDILVDVQRDAESFQIVIQPRSLTRIQAPPVVTEKFVVYFLAGADAAARTPRAVQAALAAIGKWLQRHEQEIPEDDLEACFAERPRPEGPRLTSDVLAASESDARDKDLGGRAGREHVLRVSFACNQSCGFCFVDLSKHMVPMEEVERRLEGISRQARSRDELLISGGEPAAHPRLPEIIALARRMGFRDITLQTNAVYLSRRSLVERLGALTVFASFHAHVPSLYDRLTGSRRQFPLAVRGLRNVLEVGGNALVLNVIINRLNYAVLPEYVEFIDSLRKPHAIAIFFSMLNEVGLVRTPHLGVDLREVRPWLQRALRRCRDRGIRIASLSGNCSIPLCQTEEPSRHISSSEYSQDDVRYQDAFAGGDTAGRAKASDCRTCRYDRRCRGVPVVYAQRFGLQALRPIAGAG